MRARLAIAISRQRCELREVVLRNKPQSLIQVSPKATVPVLVLPEGQVLEQSLDIMLWALRSSDPLDWLAPERENLDAMLALVHACDEAFKPELDRYKYPQRFAQEEAKPHQDGGNEQGEDAHRDRAFAHRDAGARWLYTLNARLEQSACLFGARASLADMAIAPFVRQYAHVDREWFDARPWPALRNWLDAWMASDLFASIMNKYRPWTPASDREFFP